MMNWNGHMTTVGWIFSILWIVVILALVVATIVWIARELSVRRDRGATPVSAPAIRDRRLASGEINAQHEQLRQTIGARPDSALKPPPTRPADAPARAAAGPLGG